MDLEKRHVTAGYYPGRFKKTDSLYENVDETQYLRLVQEAIEADEYEIYGHPNTFYVVSFTRDGEKYHQTTSMREMCEALSTGRIRYEPCSWAPYRSTIREAYEAYNEQSMCEIYHPKPLERSFVDRLLGWR